MNLSEPFIKRPVMTILVMVGIFFFGIFAYMNLPVSDLPNIEYPTITVSGQQPGGSPEYMANLVSLPMERNLTSISSLNTMTSNNTLGSSSIVLNFDLDVDLSSKEVEVQAAITESLPELPPMPYNPTYKKENPSETPIIYIGLSSFTASYADLYASAYNVLAQPISMINGISQVQVYGEAYAVRVQADPMRLMARSIDFNQLAQALIDSDPNLPSGTIQGRYQDYLIQTWGQPTTGEEYDKVVIQEVDGVPLFVGDVANGLSAVDVRDPYLKYITNDFVKNTVVLAVSRLPGSNTLDISDAIFKRIPELQKNIPASMELVVFYNKADEIVASVNDVQTTLIIAFLLVVIVIFVYLGKLYETIIPTVVLPMSIVATFILMYLLGFNLDNLSLLALTLAIGFVVDDSIVVLENIVRHVERGRSPYDAAMAGSAQISTTVFTMTLALSAVFIPFIWMPGIMGRIFHEFSLTIVIAIYCSGFLALTLNPMLCSRIIHARTNNDKAKPNFSERLNKKLVKGYDWLLHHSIVFKKTTLFIGFACIIGSYLVLRVLPADFIPVGNSSMIQILFQAMQGSSKVNTERHQVEVEKIIRANPYQIGFMTVGGFPTDDQGAAWIHFKKPSKRPKITKIAQELRRELNVVPGMNVYVKPFPMINLQVGATSSLGNYQYVLYGTDTETLYKAAEELTKQMKEIPELVGVNSDMRIASPQLNVEIDRDKAGVYGITATEIESTFQYAYAGGRISTFNKGIDLYNLIVEAEPGYDLTEKDVDLLYIKSPSTSELVPMTAVAHWEAVLAPSSVNHIDTFPSVTISFGLAQGAALGTALKKIDALAKETVPDNLISEVQGEAEVFIQTFKAMAWLIAVAIFVIYILLGVLYESFLHPLTILSALPVATFGGLLTLWIFDMPLSLYSVVGMIVLIGLVQKNGIMMIDFALEHIREGEDPKESILHACRQRFRPILMTTLAAMMGALPVAIGFGEMGDMNRPVGLVIFGGLLFSQLITLFVTPVVFLYIQAIHDWRAKRKQQKKSG